MGKERRGHDIYRLREELGQDTPDVLAFIDDARILDQYYIPTRFMNAFAELSVEEGVLIYER